eukprot:264574-Chlamydomonas_euryale.AAC.1
MAVLNSRPHPTPQALVANGEYRTADTIPPTYGFEWQTVNGCSHPPLQLAARRDCPPNTPFDDAERHGHRVDERAAATCCSAGAAAADVASGAAAGVAAGVASGTAAGVAAGVASGAAVACGAAAACGRGTLPRRSTHCLSWWEGEVVAQSVGCGMAQSVGRGPGTECDARSWHSVGGAVVAQSVGC